MGTSTYTDLQILQIYRFTNCCPAQLVNRECCGGGSASSCGCAGTPRPASFFGRCCPSVLHLLFLFSSGSLLRPQAMTRYHRPEAPPLLRACFQRDPPQK